MSDQIKVVAFVTVRPGTEAEMEEAARACVGPTRQEPGCLSYVLHRDLDNPRRFAFVETWRDAEALDGHFKQPHLEALMAKVQPIADGAIEIMRLTEIA
ncbi:putative quinol monooxygenase [Lichenicoccus sp.]|uniref:putative quinol monooxygenase n=1 Tax=Lichenicoccus sp. TaxID=2781899 RepID=UPI003D0DB312